jgi:oligopeptidase B
MTSPRPPAAPRTLHSTTLHGERFDDPYAWLKGREDPAVREYLEAENRYADQALEPTRPLQQRLYDELLGRIKQTDLSVPYQDGGWWYLSRTEEGKQYPVHCRRQGGEEGPEEVLLDLNEMVVGKPFMAIGAFAVSGDGRYLAYSTDDTGYRDYLLQLKDLVTGELLPLRVPKASSVAWAADGQTLFYVVDDEAKRPWQLYRHRIGTDRHQLLREERDEAFRLFVDLTRSRSFLVLSSDSHTTSEVSVLASDRPEGEWQLVAGRVQDREYALDHQGDRFVIRVNDRGRNFRLVSAPVGDPGPEQWTEIVPHRPDVMLEDVDCFEGHIVASERSAGLPRLRVLHADRREEVIPFPEAICEAYLGANRMYRSRKVRFHFQSLVTPPSVFDYDLDSGTAALRKQLEVLGGYHRTRYRSERLEAVAQDGTRVPVSLVYRTDRHRQPGPLLLEAYGSYGIPSPIGFSSNRVSLLDRGMVCAIAHIRGGGELGKPWHDAGRMAHKMNSFTDFIAAAEHLVATGWTRPEDLAIEGGSAGGLLMGAVTNLRPDLFGVVISHVPFVDLISTMSDASLPLTVGEYEEWGNPVVEEHYRWMKGYDPYRNLQPGRYPPMLVRTAFNDSQVMYWEPAKYVAKLRTLKTDDEPLLLVTNMGAGHGGASGRYDRLREIALDYAFLLTTLGVEAV